MEEKKDMPDGITWPRYKSGGPVGIGDRFTDRAGIERAVMCIRFYDDKFSIRADDGTIHFYGYGEQVGPAPVLAADGEPLEVGQAVYVIANGKTHHVTEVDAVSKRFKSMEQVDGSHWLDPMCFTHQRHVLDADGVPIKVGDTVYLLPGDWCDVFPCLGYHGGEELEVFSLNANHVEGGIGCRDTRRPRCTCYPQSSQLTHERPDTWERIEEDAGCTATKYNERRGTTFTTKQQVARDLVRRCKELSRKENNNE